LPTCANQFLSYKAPEEVISLDPQAHARDRPPRVLHTVIYLLTSIAKALRCTTSLRLPHISVAGSCSTATHGSGDKKWQLGNRRFCIGIRHRETAIC